jgi:YjbR
MLLHHSILSREFMTLAQFNAYCKSLPHAAHVVQWGGAHVWKVGGLKVGKVFAIAWFDGSVDQGITFKCSPMSFELLKEQEGCRPAPYLAATRSFPTRTSRPTCGKATGWPLPISPRSYGKSLGFSEH